MVFGINNKYNNKKDTQNRKIPKLLLKLYFGTIIAYFKGLFLKENALKYILENTLKYTLKNNFK
jgi:hypothetical protein